MLNICTCQSRYKNIKFLILISDWLVKTSMYKSDDVIQK